MMRGASAESLAALTDELGAALGGGADAARLGSELFSVAGLLRSEPGLRRVVTDVSVDGSAKQQLVSGILADKVGEGTLAILRSAVDRRWTSGRDLADSLEQLSEIATVRSAGEDSGRLADELFTFGQAVNDNAELRDALSDPARSVEDKQALVRSLLDGKALPATTALAQQSVVGTYRTVSVALDNYQDVAAEVHGERVATVRVAQPLSEEDRERLVATLSRQYDRQVHLNVVVDPEVVGGVRVEIGHHVIDGTVASRLDDARRKLAG